MNRAQRERYDALAHFAWEVTQERYPEANLRKSLVAGHFLTKDGHVQVGRIEKRLKQLGYPIKQGHMNQRSWDRIAEGDSP